MKYISLLLICFSSCRQVYDPPALKNSPHYLVVDGFLNNFPDSTSIRLSFTRNLNDTAPGQPETGAVLMIEGDRNSHIPLQEQQNGRYTGLLNLNTTENYRLRITTSQGKVYMSDYVPFKQTPPVDSLTWREDTSAVYFYIHTHDPQNSTTYYRWKFTETWLYHTYLTSNFDYINGTVVSRKSGQQIHDCWKTNSAANVLLASTAQLSQDLVSRFLFNTVSKTTEKISDQYSVEVSQYALTKDQYDYWTELKKSSEDAGSLFDGQPAQLTGNIHCLTNPSEPVMGNLSACSVAKKRIFLTINQLNSYDYTPYYLPCQVLKDVTTAFSNNDTSRAYEYLEMPNHLFTYWYFDGVNHVAQNFCIDCREHGGSNIKPVFWP